jgi:carbon monoxide dehydrogenase subunit G
MKMTGVFQLAAPPAHVWEWLNQPDVLKQCIPGCEEIERTDGGKFNAVVRLKIGPISARFKGKVHFADVSAPAYFRLVGEGEGGVAGFAKGGADVRLVEQAQGCELSYDAEAQVGGKIAQMGTRLLQGVANKLADQFFANLAEYAERASSSRMETH